MNYLLEGHQTSRLVFRKLREEDFDTWLEFFNDPISNKYWLPPFKDAGEECKSWFHKNFLRYADKTGGMNVLIEKATGSFVGQCGLLIQQVDGASELEVAYSIMPLHRNKGYASEAAQYCIEHAFTRKLSSSVISIIHANNIESEAVAKRNKMTLDKLTTYKGNPVKIYRIKIDHVI